jgi:hypothetical protein
MEAKNELGTLSSNFKLYPSYASAKGKILFLLVSDIWYQFIWWMNHVDHENRYIPMVDLVVLMSC